RWFAVGTSVHWRQIQKLKATAASFSLREKEEITTLHRNGDPKRLIGAVIRVAAIAPRRVIPSCGIEIRWCRT
ncbi:MAG: hypothetical protein ABGZ35_09100, partial [Planctomycetaceae bacterium]